MLLYMAGKNSGIGLCKTLKAISTVYKSLVPVEEAIVLGKTLISNNMGF